MCKTERDFEGVRMVPLLLLRGHSFVKTTRFKNPVYLGDPLNTIRIFNEKAVDEIVILDIDATKRRRGPDFEYIAAIAEEAFMPLAYGGGISTLDDVQRLFRSGIEKVIVNSALHRNLQLATEIARVYGSQAIAGMIDVRRSILGRHFILGEGGARARVSDPVEWALRLVDAGVGEIVLQSVDRDGTMSGYNLDQLRAVTSMVSVPVMACGGASNVENMVSAVTEGGASAVAAGAMFVFYGPHRAVLINPPSQEEFQRCLMAKMRYRQSE